MKATNENWARSYAIQALSDLNVRDTLATLNVEKCHRLHFLQMAAEKACKAHLVKQNGHEHVRKSHAYVETVLPIIARYFYAAINDQNKIRAWEIEEIKSLARQIEMLAPACDDDGLRPDNSEYPWEDGRGEICVPCRYSFPNVDDGSRALVRLIRLIRAACESFIQ